MFPFKLRFNKTLKLSADSHSVKRYLDLSVNILQDCGADFFTRESNKITYENRFFKLVSNINLMGATDAGLVEIKETGNNGLKIRYGVTLIKVLVPFPIFAIIVYFTTNELLTSLIIIGAGLFGYLITAVRHLGLFYEICREIKNLNNNGDN